jgi:UDP-N-acetylmuramoyl-tripeptide--D-alanyl-D-alanine ligase
MDVINRKDGVKIINDTYNASPQSMAAMLRLLSVISRNPDERHIAVLGDMLELGKTAKAAHKRILKLCGQLKIDKVFTFGKLWPRSYRDKKKLIKTLQHFIRPHDIILIKGSRSTRMEEVIEALL